MKLLTTILMFLMTAGSQAIAAQECQFEELTIITRSLNQDGMTVTLVKQTGAGPRALAFGCDRLERHEGYSEAICRPFNPDTAELVLTVTENGFKGIARSIDPGYLAAVFGRDSFGLGCLF